VILLALMLSACALPSLSGGSNFMSAMHPTQEFCSSRGLTLDAATKQCVAPPPPPAQPPHVAQSQPVVPQPPPQPPRPVPPQQHQRDAESVPIEPDASISPKLAQDSDQMTEFAHFVRASGYRCDSISGLRPLQTSQGFKLACNHSAYKYDIQDKEGRSIVTVE
jgi:hypothetical protein